MIGTRLFEMARADFRERTRRCGFLVTLALTLCAAVLFLPARDSGYATVDLGGWTGVYNAAWVGGTLALLAAVFLSFAGFYVVRGSIERDRRTGVGQILASTSLPGPTYLFGKALSNLLVLGAMTFILMVAALVLQFFRGEDSSIDPYVFVTPFLFVTLPVLALTAALAVLFETVPLLRGTGGNVAWFFFWVLAIVEPFGLSKVMTGQLPPFWLDPSGIGMVSWSIIRDGMAAIPGYDGTDFALGGSPLKDQSRTFVWNGIPWTFRLMAGRAFWFGVAALVVTAAVPFFDRFDAAVNAPHRKGKKGSDRDAATPPAVIPPPRTAVDLSALPGARAESRRLNQTALVIAEVRLMLNGVSKSWWIVAIGLAIAGIAAPAPGGNIVRGLALIWPLPLLSSLGCRAQLFGTGDLVFSAPRPLARLLPAAWLAGALVFLLASAGQGARAVVSGTPEAVLAWVIGAFFVAALALASGTLSGNRRLFEALYLILWYVGPMQNVTVIDYTGITAAGIAAGAWRVYGLLAMALFAVAIVVRRMSGSHV